MRWLLWLLLLAWLWPLVGCAAWLGKDEPGLKIRVNPAWGTVTVEDTSNTELDVTGLEFGDGTRTLKLEHLTRSQEVKSVREANVLQMQQAVESQRIATEALLEGYKQTIGMVGGLIGQRTAAGAASAADDAAIRRLVAEAVAEAIRAQPVPPSP